MTTITEKAPFGLWTSVESYARGDAPLALAPYVVELRDLARHVIKSVSAQDLLSMASAPAEWLIGVWAEDRHRQTETWWPRTLITEQSYLTVQHTRARRMNTARVRCCKEKGIDREDYRADVAERETHIARELQALLEQNEEEIMTDHTDRDDLIPPSEFYGAEEAGGGIPDEEPTVEEVIAEEAEAGPEPEVDPLEGIHIEGVEDIRAGDDESEHQVPEAELVLTLSPQVAGLLRDTFAAVSNGSSVTLRVAR